MSPSIISKQVVNNISNRVPIRPIENRSLDFCNRLLVYSGPFSLLSCSMLLAADPKGAASSLPSFLLQESYRSCNA